jgi:VIT1/CCC1 family predicted Fe2+/Mn2+ transporter
VPLLPFVVDVTEPFAWAVGSTGVVFFTIGAAKSLWALTPWWRSGLETLAIGMGAAGLSYAVGYWLKGLIG